VEGTLASPSLGTFSAIRHWQPASMLEWEMPMEPIESPADLEMPEAPAADAIVLPREIEDEVGLYDDSVVTLVKELREAGASAEFLHGPESRTWIGENAVEALALSLLIGIAERGLPPLPNTTPHALRRTYISIALLANEFDVRWVMGQVGHADSKMTMDVYAQLEQRVDRSHGTSFDRLIGTAREQLAGLPNGPDSAPNGRRLGDEAENRPSRAALTTRKRGRKPRHAQGRKRMARAGIEPATPRFSVVCSTN
jgi:hypothetical protein